MDGDSKESSRSNGANSLGPVGSGDCIVNDGDCISSIASNSGHYWKTIWDYGPNSELKNKRKDPNILLPGDRLTIPPLTLKEELGSTEKRHSFVLKGVPSLFRIKIFLDGKPRVGEPWSVLMGGRVLHSGKIGSDALVKFPIPGNAERALLRVGEGEDLQELDLLFGNLDPITEISGVKQRLKNLGYALDPTNDVITGQTAAAVRAFQHDNGLEATGELDDATKRKIQAIYGS